MEEIILKLLNINALKFLNTSNRIKQGIINYVYYIVEFILYYCEDLIKGYIGDIKELDNNIQKLANKLAIVKNIEPFVNNTIYIKFKTLTPTYVTDKPLLYLRQIPYAGMKIETNIIAYWDTTERTGNENDTTIKLTNFKIYNNSTVGNTEYYKSLFDTFKNGNAILYVVNGTGYDIVRPYKTIRESDGSYALFKINNTTYKIQEPKLE